MSGFIGHFAERYNPLTTISSILVRAKKGQERKEELWLSIRKVDKISFHPLGKLQ